VALGDEVVVDSMPLRSTPRAEMKAKVGIGSNYAHRVPGREVLQRAVDEQMTAAIEAEPVKVDSRRQ
jgi:hypothetical protein